MPLRSSLLLACALLGLGGCGQAQPSRLVGSYALGSPDLAIAKARYYASPNRSRAYLLGYPVPQHVLESVLQDTHVLLVLRRDGSFHYYGPPQIDVEDVHLRGTWRIDGGSLLLSVTEARAGIRSRAIRCEIRPGRVSFPAGRKEGNDVFFDLVLGDPFDGKVPSQAGRIRTEPARPTAGQR